MKQPTGLIEAAFGEYLRESDARGESASYSDYEAGYLACYEQSPKPIEPDGDLIEAAREFLDNYVVANNSETTVSMMARFASAYHAEQSAKAVARREAEITDELIAAHKKGYCEIRVHGIGTCSICDYIEKLRRQ